MNFVKPVTVTALAIAMIPGVYVNANPMPALMLTSSEMPQVVPQLDTGRQSHEDDTVYAAVKLYHELRKSFKISHTTMAGWLGVKRRTLYNWMNHSTKTSRYGEQIESRLYQLRKFRDNIEPEHIQLVNKIAFSPIYGAPEFGVAILDGCDSKELSKWYDKLFSRFESYKSVQNKNTRLS